MWKSILYVDREGLSDNENKWLIAYVRCKLNDSKWWIHGSKVHIINRQYWNRWHWLQIDNKVQGQEYTTSYYGGMKPYIIT